MKPLPLMLDRSISDELLERTRALLPIFARNARIADEARSLPDENIQVLEESGLLEIICPVRRGGLGGTFTARTECAIEIAKVCPSTSWVFGLLGSSVWNASMLPAKLQDELFSGERRPRMAGSVTPGGVLEPVEGGYVVNGRWPYSTGCLWANWISGGASVRREDGGLTPGAMVIMPRDGVTIEDTWFTTGMRGTASSTAVAQDLFVPEHRVIAGPPKPMEGGAPSDAWPFITLLIHHKAPVALGAAEGILSRVLEAASGGRHYPFSNYGQMQESQVVQHHIGRAALKLKAARTLLLQCTEELDRLAEARSEISIPVRTALRAQQSYINEEVREAADILLTVFGTSALTQGEPIEMLWRDLSVITRHGLVATHLGYESYGRTLLNIEPNNIPARFL